MATFTIRVLRGNRIKRARKGFFNSISGITDLFESVNVLSDSSTGCDLELKWAEERTINNVVADKGITTIQIRLEKTGYLSVRDCGSYWYSSSLGRHSTSLSSKSIAPFNLTPIKLDLGACLSEKSFKGMLFENVRISDLSVDTIPSLKAEIPSCTRTSLMNLIRGTHARITAFTLTPSSERRLTFSTNGTVKVRLPEPSWEQAIQEIESLMKALIYTY